MSDQRSSGPLETGCAAETQTTPEESPSYFVRHWRGDLTLAESFWVNTIIVNLVFGLLTEALKKVEIMSVAGSAAYVIIFWVVAVCLASWKRFRRVSG